MIGRYIEIVYPDPTRIRGRLPVAERLRPKQLLVGEQRLATKLCEVFINLPDGTPSREFIPLECALRRAVAGEA